jgi:hypothetical protein
MAEIRNQKTQINHHDLVFYSTTNKRNTSSMLSVIYHNTESWRNTAHLSSRLPKKIGTKLG